VPCKLSNGHAWKSLFRLLSPGAVQNKANCNATVEDAVYIPPGYQGSGSECRSTRTGMDHADYPRSPIAWI
jgi:hypothetical protein